MAQSNYNNTYNHIYCRAISSQTKETDIRLLLLPVMVNCYYYLKSTKRYETFMTVELEGRGGVKKRLNIFIPQTTRYQIIKIQAYKQNKKLLLSNMFSYTHLIPEALQPSILVKRIKKEKKSISLIIHKIKQNWIFYESKYKIVFLRFSVLYFV